MQQYEATLIIKTYIQNPNYMLLLDWFHLFLTNFTSFQRSYKVSTPTVASLDPAGLRRQHQRGKASWHETVNWGFPTWILFHPILTYLLLITCCDQSTRTKYHLIQQMISALSLSNTKVSICSNVSNTEFLNSTIII